MKRKNKAFTLIELLAIIVILAIIAVITVPIILNIIENSRKGAATDSAYGYKDAVNKYYVTELSDNNNLKLDGEYTVNAGILNGSGISNKDIPVSGTIPSSGTLTYENGVFKSGCLVIGDYAVTFNTDETTSTEKGECSPSVPTIETCPGCVFTYTKDIWHYSGTPTTLTSTQYKENYEDVISESGKNHFFGLKLNASGTIERAFSCGVENGTPFCLEGTTDGSKYSDNIGIINTMFPSCGASASSSLASCNGASVISVANAKGFVKVSNGSNGFCIVSNDGYMYCDEW